MAVTGVSLKDKHGNKVTAAKNVYYWSQTFDSGAVFTGTEYIGGNNVATTGDYYNYELSDVKRGIFRRNRGTGQLINVNKGVSGVQSGALQVELELEYFGYHPLMAKLGRSFDSNIYGRLAWYEIMFNATTGAEEYTKRVFPLCYVDPAFEDARDGVNLEKTNIIKFVALDIAGTTYLEADSVTTVDAVGAEDYAVS